LRDPRHAYVLAEYHNKFQSIMVDDYQDTNVAQYMWLRLLAKASGNICCVGDDDQSIYGWRGAEVGNILRFEQDFPNATIIRLEENYRSTGHILAAANALIAKNEGRLGKTLFTSSGDGEKLTVQGLWDGEAEARWIGEEIEQLQKKQWALKNIAVLVRAGFQMREFEERFMQLNIPYKVIGGPRFYERQEIRDALAYFRIVVQPADDLALERIINVPKRGIGDSTVQTLYAHARATGICLQDSIYHLSETDELPKRAQTPLMALMDNLRRWRELLEDTPHTQVAAQILEESGYLTMWKTDKNPDSAGRVENLKELISGMAEFESLPHFLEHVALVLENRGDNDRESVSIMTLHGAKGLEFDAVFLPGWEEGLFPSQRSMDGNGLRGLEEERRLAYVGITRARKKSYVSYAANRRMYGSYNSAIPSRFVDELPEEHIETASATGIYDRSDGRSRHWDSSGIRPSPQPSPLREREATQQTGEGFSKGTKVTHDKFGTGTVVHIDGHKLDIQFDVGGIKRVMDSFVQKTTS
jgi:DNA helicase-2/ATP-dependent DNA helicase PcrA